VLSNNHEKFNYLVGRIFADLLENFPRRVEISTVEYAGVTHCPATVDETGAWTGIYLRDGVEVDVREELDFIYDTVRWLHESGYLIGHVGNTRALSRWISVTLSHKALELLKAIPASVEANTASKSFGSSLIDAVKSSATTKVADLAGDALTYAAKLGWSAVTST
jgi:hypothetical protein